MSIADSLKQRLSRPDTAADPAYAFGAEDAQAAPVRERKPARGFSRRAGSFLSDLRNRISGGEDPSFDDPYYDPEREAARQGYDPAYPQEQPGYDAYGRSPYDPYRQPSYADYAEAEPPLDYDEEAYIPPVQEDHDYNYYAAPQPPAPMGGDPAAFGAAGQARPAPESAASRPSSPAYPPAGSGYAYGEPDPGEAAFYGGYAPRDAYSDFAPEAAYPPPPDAGGEWYGGKNMPQQAPVRPMKPRKAVSARDVGYYFWSFGIVAGMLLTVAAFIYGCIA